MENTLGDYQQDCEYDLRLKEVSVESGWTQLVLSENIPGLLKRDFTVRTFKFQRTWLNDPTKKGMLIPCIVVYADADRVIWRQSPRFVNTYCYGDAVGQPLRLRIIELPGPNSNFVKLKDDETGLEHSAPLWLFNGTEQEPLHEEQIVTLKIKEINGKNGNLHFEPQLSREERELGRLETYGDTSRANESATLEYKRSIVFSANSSAVDFGFQLEYVIMREIASFLNTQGGVLKLGYDDEGRVVGLEEDLRYLCEYTGMPYKYKATMDSFALLIKDVAERFLKGPFLSEDLMNITAYQAPRADGKMVRICIVRLGIAPQPVFLRVQTEREKVSSGYALYVRKGSSCVSVDPVHWAECFSRMADIPQTPTAGQKDAAAGLTPMSDAQKQETVTEKAAAKESTLLLQQQSAMKKVFSPLDEKSGRTIAMLFMDGRVYTGTRKGFLEAGHTMDEVLLTVRLGYKQKIDRLFLFTEDMQKYRLFRLTGRKSDTESDGPAAADLKYPLLSGKNDWLIELCECNGSYSYRSIPMDRLLTPVVSLSGKAKAKGLLPAEKRPEGARYYYARGDESDYALHGTAQGGFRYVSSQDIEEPDSILRYFRGAFVESEKEA